MLSLAPAARIWGANGLTPTAGSFCLFWEKMVSLLPTVTSVSPPGGRLRDRQARGEQSQADRQDQSARTRAATRVVRMAPPVVDRNTVDAGSLRWPPYATVILRPRAPASILTPYELSEKILY